MVPLRRGLRWSRPASEGRSACLSSSNADRPRESGRSVSDSVGTNRTARGILALAITFLSVCPAASETEEGVVEGTTLAWQRTTVSSPVEEIVAEVLAEEGQTVEKGDLLARLASRKQELEVLRLDQLIETARFIYEATVALEKDKIESKETLMEKKSDLDQLLIAREVAAADVEDRQIHAPVSGVIVHRLKEPGESVERVGPLFEIIDVSRLKLMFFLPVAHLPKLETGMTCPVEFPDFPSEQSFTAKLIFIDPQVDPRSGLFRARFEFDNSKAQVKPGVKVRATLADR